MFPVDNQTNRLPTRICKRLAGDGRKPHKGSQDQPRIGGDTDWLRKAR